MVNSLQTIELTDGGVLLYKETFLPSELADRYFVTIRDECTWEQKPGIFGHMQPRLTASYGDDGATYRYSGIEELLFRVLSAGRHFEHRDYRTDKSPTLR